MQELHLTTSGEFANPISELLFELGSLAITLTDAQDNPIFEPPPEALPLWPSIKLMALFADEQALDQIMLQLYSRIDPSTIQHISCSQIKEQDWVRETQQQTKPLCFGERLWIYPSWHAEPSAAGIKILLDPGLAFGTGSHATTALMLTWIAQHALENLTVLDYGCGSGILAVAAAKSGAKKVWCTDIDPQALLATRENANRNHIRETQLSIAMPAVLPADLKVDVILANILAEPLIELAPQFSAYLHKQGLVVLSGILNTQIPEITRVYEKHFVWVETHSQNEWASMVWINS